MAKENYEICFPKLFRIILFYFVSLHSHTFTVVEENVEIGLSEMPQNSLFLLFLFIPSAWLRNVEILHSETPKKDLSYVLLKPRSRFYLYSTFPNTLIDLQQVL